MKTNKYRVWCKNRNEWEKDDEVCLLQDGSLLQFRDHNILVPLLNKTHVVEFYLGLEDKNGIEYCMGDIVKDRAGRLGKVVYSTSDGLFKCAFGLTGINYDQGPGMWSVWQNQEIVGNIHENPELLK